MSCRRNAEQTAETQDDLVDPTGQVQRDEAMAHGLMVGAFDHFATAIRASGGLAHGPLGRAGSLRVNLGVCSIRLVPRYSLGGRTCASSQSEWG